MCALRLALEARTKRNYMEGQDNITSNNSYSNKNKKNNINNKNNNTNILS